MTNRHERRRAERAARNAMRDLPPSCTYRYEGCHHHVEGFGWAIPGGAYRVAVASTGDHERVTIHLTAHGELKHRQVTLLHAADDARNLVASMTGARGHEAGHGGTREQRHAAYHAAVVSGTAARWWEYVRDDHGVDLAAEWIEAEADLFADGHVRDAYMATVVSDCFQPVAPTPVEQMEAVAEARRRQPGGLHDIPAVVANGNPPWVRLAFLLNAADMARDQVGYGGGATVRRDAYMAAVANLRAMGLTQPDDSVEHEANRFAVGVVRDGTSYAGYHGDGVELRVGLEDQP